MKICCLKLALGAARFCSYQISSKIQPPKSTSSNAEKKSYSSNRSGCIFSLKKLRALGSGQKRFSDRIFRKIKIACRSQVRCTIILVVPMDDAAYYDVELLARSGQQLHSFQIHGRRLLYDLVNSIYAQAFGLEDVFDLEDYLQQELYASLPLVLLSRYIHEQKLETRIEEYVKSSLRSSNGSEARQQILKVRLTKQPPETQEILRNFRERVDKIRENNKQFFANEATQSCGIKINKIEPNAGTIFGGDKVLIRGENFEGNYCVRFGATIVPSKLVDPKTLECITPSHSSGPVTVSICPLSMTNTTVAWLLGPIFTFIGPSASCPIPLACPAEGGAPLALTSPCRTNDLTVAPPIAK